MHKRFLFLVLLVIFAGIVLHLSAALISGQGSRVIILWPNPEKAKPNLQLYTFPYITIAPEMIDNKTISGSPVFIPGTPAKGPYCPLDGIRPNGSDCRCLDNNAIACPAPNGISSTCPPSANGMPGFLMPLPPGSSNWYCIDVRGSGLFEEPPDPPAGCFSACIAKPVIYLYPEKPTKVDVEIITEGKVVISDPNYPDGGWKDVLAYPDGRLVYEGKIYRELFYETSLERNIDMPETGMIIPIERLEIELDKALYLLGLKGIEKEEFLEYWVPVLKGLDAPYIFFSVIPESVKREVDRLKINPEPETRIEIVAYFKALKEPIEVGEMKLPEAPPLRKGFVEVEWGGMIGQ